MKMLNQPLEALMKKGKFSLEDLEMNRQGKLSAKQKRKILLLLVVIAIFLILVLIVFSIGALLNRQVRLAVSQWPVFLWILGVFMLWLCIFIIETYHHIYITGVIRLKKPVKCVTGKIETKAIYSVSMARSGQYTEMYIKIKDNPQKFILKKSKLWKILSIGESYKLYFIPVRKHSIDSKAQVLTLEPT